MQTQEMHVCTLKSLNGESWDNGKQHLSQMGWKFLGLHGVCIQGSLLIYTGRDLLILITMRNTNPADSLHFSPG